MIETSTTLEGRPLSLIEVWDQAASSAIVHGALIPSIVWQTNRGRDVFGKPFKPLTHEYAYRWGLDPDKPRQVRTGRLMTIVQEKTGRADSAGILWFVNRHSGGLRLNYKAPGAWGYIYAHSARYFLGWNSRGRKLFKAQMSAILDRLMPEGPGPLGANGPEEGTPSVINGRAAMGDRETDRVSRRTAKKLKASDRKRPSRAKKKAGN